MNGHVIDGRYAMGAAVRTGAIVGGVGGNDGES